MSLQQSLFVRCGLPALFVLIAMLWFACPAFAAGPTEYVIYSFPANKSAGSEPVGNLVADSAGNLYGTASAGGEFGDGDVYELLRPVPPSTKWTQTVLYSFTGGSDGELPNAGVIFDQAGNLYGTAEFGGDSVGVVFELAPPATAGGQWTESLLYTFQGLSGDDGDYPYSGLVFDTSGNLYGTTIYGDVRDTMQTATPDAAPYFSCGPLPRKERRGQRP
ncbi:MAG: choice-of-anchor tandem repeat GloVer-containing protein [Candidatus Sulfotelmatobacter sp.]